VLSNSLEKLPARPLAAGRFCHRSDASESETLLDVKAASPAPRAASEDDEMLPLLLPLVQRHHWPSASLPLASITGCLLIEIAQQRI
jgi:hypothetical protein